MNSYESSAREEALKIVDDEAKKISSSSLEEEEKERRATVLAEFLEVNDDFHFDNEVLANDIPPRITKKLETGKISFEEFLQECYDYTKTGKVVKQDKVPNQPDLGKIGGGNSPDKNAVKEDAITSYNKEVY